MWCTLITKRVAQGEKLSNHLEFVVGLGAEEFSLPNLLACLFCLLEHRVTMMHGPVEIFLSSKQCEDARFHIKYSFVGHLILLFLRCLEILWRLFS